MQPERRDGLQVAFSRNQALPLDVSLEAVDSDLARSALNYAFWTEHAAEYLSRQGLMRGKIY